MTHTLVIDQGTHASRAIIFSSTGKIIESAEQPVHLIKKDHLHIEQDAEEILQSVKTVINKILKKHTTDIKNCALATQRSTMLAWHTESLKSLHPALNWQDRRSEEDLQQFKNNEKLIQKITGLPLSAHYGAGKFRWLLKKLNKQSNSLSLGPLVSYLLCHLTTNKQSMVDHSNAHRTLLFDLHKLNWSDELLQLFDIDKKFLPLCKPVQYNYGQLLDTGIPVTAVCGDQNAALFSQGTIPNNTAIVNLGTGAFILLPNKQTHNETRLLQGIARSNSHIDYLIEGTVNGAGAALSWAEQQWPVNDLYRQLENWLKSIQRPPIFINTVGGLGSPWWISDVEPFFINDTAQTEYGPRYVAIMESIIFLIQHNLEQMKGYTDITHLRVSGGLSRLDTLCQKLANLSGCQVERRDDTEATARGAAWLASNSPEDWAMPASKNTFTPHYQADFYQRYQIFTAEISRF